MPRFWILSGVLCCAAIAIAAAAKADLYMDANQGDLVQAARSIIEKVPFPALISLDADGKPRARTVEIRPLGDDLAFWIATRPNTRKVEQIRHNPKVSLYFSVDSEFSYVSVMGTAILHEDEETKATISWRDEARRKAFWPNFPNDYLLIEVRPEWIEVTGEGIATHPIDWRPQAIVVEE
jgi:general stress protein 26